MRVTPAQHSKNVTLTKTEGFGRSLTANECATIVKTQNGLPTPSHCFNMFRTWPSGPLGSAYLCPRFCCMGRRVQGVTF